jgi:hypothetical protein
MNEPGPFQNGPAEVCEGGGRSQPEFPKRTLAPRTFTRNTTRSGAPGRNRTSDTRFRKRCAPLHRLSWRGAGPRCSWGPLAGPLFRGRWVLRAKGHIMLRP